MASWLSREAARAFEELPRVSPLLGTSDFIEGDDEDSAFWVLGPSRPVQREAGALTLAAQSSHSLVSPFEAIYCAIEPQCAQPWHYGSPDVRLRLMREWQFSSFDVKEIIRGIDRERMQRSDLSSIDPRPMSATRFPDDTLRDLLSHARGALPGLSAVERQRLQAEWLGTPNVGGVRVYVS